LRLLQKAAERTSVRLPGYCLMADHFQLVPRPLRDGDLSE
jgi:hypothetical protein